MDGSKEKFWRYRHDVILARLSVDDRQAALSRRSLLLGDELDN